MDAGAWKGLDAGERAFVARIVPAPKGTPGKQPVSCACGDCNVCKKRQWMRDYRAAGPAKPRKKKGPTLDPHRGCYGCGRPVAQMNQTGWCIHCQRHMGYRRLHNYGGKAALGFFSDGGGI